MANGDGCGTMLGSVEAGACDDFPKGKGIKVYVRTGRGLIGRDGEVRLSVSVSGRPHGVTPSVEQPVLLAPHPSA